MIERGQQGGMPPNIVGEMTYRLNKTVRNWAIGLRREHGFKIPEARLEGLVTDVLFDLRIGWQKWRALKDVERQLRVADKERA